MYDDVEILHDRLVSVYGWKRVKVDRDMGRVKIVFERGVWVRIDCKTYSKPPLFAISHISPERSERNTIQGCHKSNVDDVLSYVEALYKKIQQCEG